MSKPLLSCSVVVPVYSGEPFLCELADELAELRHRWRESSSPVELTDAVFVLDDPIDGSASVVEKIAEKHSWITPLTLSRNFGQHPATQAGILHSSGDWIVTMDEDLQHRPAMIDSLFRRAAAGGFDIVYAQPASAVHMSLVRDLGSRGYKWFVAKLTGNENVRHFNSFRLIRGSIGRAASSVCSHDTYFDIALSWFTGRVGVEKLELLDQRYAEIKKSGYSMYKLFSHARRMVLSAQVKALRFGLLVGILGLVVGGAYGLRIVLGRLFFGIEPAVQGWSSLMVAFLFYGGIITLMIGIVIEFLTLLILHIQGKPVFFQVDRREDKLLLPYFSAR